MRTDTYIDRLVTRNLKQYKYNGLIAYTYEDYFYGQWLGNLNIFKDGKGILHATTSGLLSDEEVMERLKAMCK